MSQRAVFPILLPIQKHLPKHMQSFTFYQQDALIGPPIKLCFVSKSIWKVKVTYTMTFSALASNTVEKGRREDL